MRWLLLGFLLLACPAFAQAPPTSTTSGVAQPLRALQVSPADPTGTTSTASFVMMGLGSTASFTPTRSGTVEVTISGSIKNSASGDGAFLSPRYGTGSAPANAAALTGTGASGQTPRFVAAANDQAVPFSTTFQASGLTLGTAYWFDLAVRAITGGTANILDLTVTFKEL